MSVRYKSSRSLQHMTMVSHFKYMYWINQTHFKFDFAYFWCSFVCVCVCVCVCASLQECALCAYLCTYTFLDTYILLADCMISHTSTYNFSHQFMSGDSSTNKTTDHVSVLKTINLFSFSQAGLTLEAETVKDVCIR